MIKLEAVPPPSQLTPQLVEDLTAKFKQDGSAVWNKEFIKNRLLEMSNGKCAYSEIKLRVEGKYVEVEHFLPKSAYPDKVVEWDNLLPASKFCNSKKGDKTHPIVHPVRDIPKEHLYLDELHFMSGKTPKGKNSVIILGLNDSEHLLKPRLAIRDAIQAELSKQKYLLSFYERETTENQGLLLTGFLINLLKQGTRKEAYSATVATTILNDPHFLAIKNVFIANNLWTSEIEVLEDELKFCALDTKP
ncbi:HNH endonuclease domain-containing protein [Arcicella rosea]|uniref:HNH nuclease domain-containing protein n=1 Tax=Arcicella rosea TaxID=502909 RepID=A0A841EXN1_9BACT|nr:HNH endonuclease domain-containing protein [Arcicella rosea]MBB6005080.1 hypothetical protein [Arcicella rosea]